MTEKRRGAESELLPSGLGFCQGDHFDGLSCAYIKQEENIKINLSSPLQRWKVFKKPVWNHNDMSLRWCWSASTCLARLSFGSLSLMEGFFCSPSASLSKQAPGTSETLFYLPVKPLYLNTVSNNMPFKCKYWTRGGSRCRLEANLHNNSLLVAVSAEGLGFWCDGAQTGFSAGGPLAPEDIRPTVTCFVLLLNPSNAPPLPYLLLMLTREGIWTHLSLFLTWLLHFSPCWPRMQESIFKF